MAKKIKPERENINYDIENHEAFVKERRKKGKIFYNNMKKSNLINFNKSVDKDLWNEDIWEL